MKRSVAALLALAFIASGCTKSGGTTAAGANSWTVPHVLRFANAEDVTTLNPMLSTEETLAYMSSLTAAFLVKWDPQNKPYPELATAVPTKANGGVSADGLTITYHLRPGLKWSDGAPLTADDVVWTYHAVMNPANNVASRTGWDLITRVDEPNKTTVVFHLKSPYSPFVVTFFSSAGANPSILPKHLLAKYPNINNVPFNALPIGAGPFEYKEWIRGQKIVMVPNPYYFRGQPKLKEIDFEIIPSRDTILAQLAAHELDMWAHVGGTYLVRTKSISGYRNLTQPAYQWTHLDFNLSHSALADPSVRYAIELAIDRKMLLDKVFFGYGYLQEGIAPHTAPYYDPKIPFVNFDLAKANRVLDQAGWVRGADGVRVKNGVRLELSFAAIAGAQNVLDMIELMRQDWLKIGVKLDLKTYAVGQFFNAYQSGGILYGGKWDLTAFNWFDDPIGDFSYIYACDQVPPNGQNVLHWCNPIADAAVHHVFKDYDQAARNADDAKLFEQLAKDRPQVTLWGVEEGYVVNTDLTGFEPNGVSPFDNMMNVDI